MRYVTIDQVIRWRCCYTRKEIERLFAGRKRINAKDIAAMRRVPAYDRLWALSHMLSPVQSARIVKARPDVFNAYDCSMTRKGGNWYWMAADKELAALRLAVAELMRG